MISIRISDGSAIGRCRRCSGRMGPMPISMRMASGELELLQTIYIMQLVIKLFSAALLFCACHSGGTPAGTTVPAGPAAAAPGTDSLALLLKQWREDSVGCQHVRNIGSFERLLKGYSLSQKNKGEILQVLGPPNAEEKYPGKSIVSYYFGSVCAANKVIKGSDKSRIMLTFDDQKRYLRYDTAIE